MNTLVYTAGNMIVDSIVRRWMFLLSGLDFYIRPARRRLARGTKRRPREVRIYEKPLYLSLTRILGTNISLFVCVTGNSPALAVVIVVVG
jgi:hypothetical protein